MGAVRLVLGVIMVGAGVLFLAAAVHGFHGSYCFESSGRCTSSDVVLQWHTIVWLAPLIAVVALAAQIVFRRHQ